MYPGVVFTNIPNLSLILVIKFMTFVLVKIGPNLVFTKLVLAGTIFLALVSPHIHKKIHKIRSLLLELSRT